MTEAKRDGTEARFRDDPENHRYVVEIGDEVVGHAVYHVRGDRYLFVHTEVNAELTGRGLGRGLVGYALDDMASRQELVVPICPLFVSFIESNPEYGEIVDWPLLDRITRSNRDDGSARDR